MCCVFNLSSPLLRRKPRRMEGWSGLFGAGKSHQSLHTMNRISQLFCSLTQYQRRYTHTRINTYTLVRRHFLGGHKWEPAAAPNPRTSTQNRVSTPRRSPTSTVWLYQPSPSRPQTDGLFMETIRRLCLSLCLCLRGRGVCTQSGGKGVGKG